MRIGEHEAEKLNYRFFIFWSDVEDEADEEDDWVSIEE